MHRYSVTASTITDLMLSNISKNKRSVGQIAHLSNNSLHEISFMESNAKYLNHTETRDFGKKYIQI